MLETSLGVIGAIIIAFGIAFGVLYATGLSQILTLCKGMTGSKETRTYTLPPSMAGLAFMGVFLSSGPEAVICKMQKKCMFEW